MVRVSNVVSAAAVVWLSATGLAQACQTEKLLFRDNFDKSNLAENWLLDGKGQVVKGYLAFAPEPGKRATALTAQTFDDIDVCAIVVIEETPDVTDTEAGVVFWATDQNTFYVLEIRATGRVFVDRVKDNAWDETIYLSEEAAQKDVHVLNEIRVVTLGNTATFYVNGESVGSITGEPPKEGQRVGFFAGSARAGRSTLGMDDLVVNVAEKGGDPVVAQLPDPDPLGLSPRDRTIYDNLIAEGLAQESDWYAGKITEEPGPPRAIVFPFESLDPFEMAEAKVFFRFLGDGTASADFEQLTSVAKAKSKANGRAVKSGEIRDEASNTTFRWVGKVEGPADSEWIIVAAQRLSIVFGVEVDWSRDEARDDLDPETLSFAIQTAKVALESLLRAEKKVTFDDPILDISRGFADFLALAVCDNVGETLFRDTFDQSPPQGHWLVQGKGEVANGQLRLSPEAGKLRTALTNQKFDNIDACATVAVQASPDLSDTEAGIVFWAKDADNYYVFQIRANGEAMVHRRKDGQWENKINMTADGVRQGVGALNAIRVVTQGSTATFLVNQVATGSISGEPPEGGQRVGFYAGSARAGASTLSLDVFVVKNVAGQ